MLHGANAKEVTFTVVFMKSGISWLFHEERKLFIEKKKSQHGGNRYILKLLLIDFG